jgi:hypothetical protein
MLFPKKRLCAPFFGKFSFERGTIVNKHVVAISDLLMLLVGGYALVKAVPGYGVWFMIAVMVIVFLSLLPIFRGTSPKHLLGIWLVRFFGLAVVGLFSSQRMALYSALAASLALVLLALFWPRKNTPEYKAREEEAQKLHGNIPGSEEKSFWVVMAGIFFLIAIYTVGAMTYQVVFGNIRDWQEGIYKAIGMFAALTLAAMCLKTNGGTWKKSPFIIYGIPKEKA